MESPSTRSPLRRDRASVLDVEMVALRRQIQNVRKRLAAVERERAGLGGTPPGARAQGEGPMDPTEGEAAAQAYADRLELKLQQREQESALLRERYRRQVALLRRSIEQLGAERDELAARRRGFLRGLIGS